MLLPWRAGIARGVAWQRGRQAGTTCSGRTSGMHGYTQNEDVCIKRLRRVDGQVRGLQRMVAGDRHGTGVLTPVAAA